MQEVVTKNLDNYILTAAEREAELRPALLFRGNMTEHRARTLFCLTQFLRDNNIVEIGQGRTMIDNAIEARHRAGSHAQKQDGMTWARWLTRIMSAPKVFEIDPPLRGYVDELYQSVSWLNKFKLTPIPETARQTHRAWRKIVCDTEPMTTHYPFHKGNIDNNLLWLVHNAVPKHLDEDIRADVCQDVIVSIISGDYHHYQMSQAVRVCLKRHRAMYCDRWKTVSLDAPIYDKFGGETKLTLKDFLKA